MTLVENTRGLNKSVVIEKCPEIELKTIKEFYDVLIEPNLLNKEAVLAWHSIFERYIREEKPFFILRKYSSSKINDEWATRRGMITEYKNGRYVGVDNYFPQLIYALVKMNYVPDYEEFVTAMNTRQMPVRFNRQTGIERDKSGFPSVKFTNVGINNNNWKLSHILSANTGFSPEIKIILKDNFKNTKNDDWTFDDGKGYYSRFIESDLSAEEIRVLKVHLLRVCSPLNFVLTPKKSFHIHELDGNDIGETKEVLEYIRRKFLNRYGEVFSKFLQVADYNESPVDKRTTEEIGMIGIGLITKKNINKNENGTSESKLTNSND